MNTYKVKYLESLQNMERMQRTHLSFFPLSIFWSVFTFSRFHFAASTCRRSLIRIQSSDIINHRHYFFARRMHTRFIIVSRDNEITERTEANKVEARQTRRGLEIISKKRRDRESRKSSWKNQFSWNESDKSAIQCLSH